MKFGMIFLDSIMDCYILTDILDVQIQTCRFPNSNNHLHLSFLTKNKTFLLILLRHLIRKERE